jgi:hypothetical protein
MEVARGREALGTRMNCSWLGLMNVYNPHSKSPSTELMYNCDVDVADFDPVSWIFHSFLCRTQTSFNKWHPVTWPYHIAWQRATFATLDTRSFAKQWRQQLLYVFSRNIITLELFNIFHFNCLRWSWKSTRESRKSTRESRKSARESRKSTRVSHKSARESRKSTRWNQPSWERESRVLQTTRKAVSMRTLFEFFRSTFGTLRPRGHAYQRQAVQMRFLWTFVRGRKHALQSYAHAYWQPCISVQ